ncbi:hypothetical protein [Tissierella sp. Yu-01]|uniref:hypothetical protein n=1 Tax=Tissierella sp. Yu-01 TaxID=3035694 RepID=UPI00240D4793|nr:hypothetical protein [Tissierella sp. Yu-01]WFA10324.1 hypothetical protein P3962_07170 [Tissierella sp. Yu-01]
MSDKITVSYENMQDRESLYQYYKNAGYVLIEEHNITEGNFLIFDTKPNQPVENVPSEEDILKAQNKALADRQEFIEDLIAELAMMVYD